MLDVFYATAGAMMVIDQSSAQVTETFPSGTPPLYGEVVDPATGLIYVAGPDGGNLTAISTKLNRIVQSFPAPRFTPSAVAGGQVYGAGSEKGIQWPAGVFNLATSVSSDLPPPTSATGGTFEWIGGGSPPNGATFWGRFLFANAGTGHIFGIGIGVYDTATNVVLGAFAVTMHSYTALAFSPDSSTAYIAESGLIAVYNTTTIQETATYPVAETFSALAASPDGLVLFATNGYAVYALDAATGTQRHVFELPATVRADVAISPDGTTLFLLESGGNTVDLVNVLDWTVTRVTVPYAPTSVVTLK
jgi:DNA-binding beta-propeller fold protein YncE